MYTVVVKNNKYLPCCYLTTCCYYVLSTPILIHKCYLLPTPPILPMLVCAIAPVSPFCFILPLSVTISPAFYLQPFRKPLPVY